MNVIHIGLGGNARRWLALVRQRLDMKSVASVDPDASALDWVRTSFPAQQDTCHEQLDTALRHVTADAAIIASPLPLRAGQAIQALEAGLTVMIEAPFAASLAEAAQVMNASRRTGHPLIVARNYHHTRSEATVHRLVREGMVGAITHVSCIDRRSRPAQDPVQPQVDYAQVLEVGAYHFDGLRRLLRVNPVRVMARCTRAPWSAYQHGSTTEALLETEHNIHIQYHGSLTTDRNEHALWVEGDRGVLWTNRSRPWWRKRGWRLFLPIRADKVPAGGGSPCMAEGADTGLDQLKAAVTGRRPPDTCGENDLWTVAMVEAVLLSDRMGRAVQIDHLVHAAGLTLPTSAPWAPGGRS